MSGENHMKNNIIKHALNKLNIIFSKSRVIPHSGLVIPGEMLKAVKFSKKIDEHSNKSKEYSNSEILKSMMITILCADPDFATISETYDDPEFYCNAMKMRSIPSEPTLRQRMDEIGDSLKYVLREITTDLFLTYGIEPSALENGYVPIDIDVSPFIDENCSKQGIETTYKKKDGYAPIFAYIGTEGYLLACELRSGSQHCQKGTPEFLLEVIAQARKITDKPLLIRLDSGNDAAENIILFMNKCIAGERVHFIIKRNIRIK